MALDGACGRPETDPGRQRQPSAPEDLEETALIAVIWSPPNCPYSASLILKVHVSSCLRISVRENTATHKFRAQSSVVPAFSEKASAK